MLNLPKRVKTVNLATDRDREITERWQANISAGGDARGCPVPAPSCPRVRLESLITA